MKKKFLCAVGIMLLSGVAMMGAQAQRWIHVRVENVKGVSGNVSFNVPVEMAEAVLPSIPAGQQNQGKFKLQASVNGMDLRAVLDAVRKSPDNVFVTIERRDREVSVAKAGRDLLIKIAEKPSEEHLGETVAIRVPIPVVKAMLTKNSDDLDVGAGIRALAKEGDVDVTVNNEKQTVRVWTDTRTSSD